MGDAPAAGERRGESLWQAITAGTRAASGEFIFIRDAYGSCDFSAFGSFVEKLRDFVPAESGLDFLRIHCFFRRTQGVREEIATTEGSVRGTWIRLLEGDSGGY